MVEKMGGTVKKKRHLKPGDKIHKLTVIKYDHSDNHYRSYFLFKCDCGNEKVILGSGVVSGNTKSCGCLFKEFGRKKRISENHSEVTAIICGYKRHAKDRNIPWKLKRITVESIIKEKCHYCGANPSNIKKTKNSLGNGLKYSGIDRIDSSKGYTKSNVVPCCKVCNYAKSNMTIEEFRKWAKRLGKRAMARQWGAVL